MQAANKSQWDKSFSVNEYFQNAAKIIEIDIGECPNFKGPLSKVMESLFRKSKTMVTIKAHSGRGIQ